MRFFMLLFLFSGLYVQGQENLIQPETLIVELVIGDPVSIMPTQPTGMDQDWVNYDQDQLTGLCVTGGEETPDGWFVERDFGFLNPEDTDNDAFTSCSYLEFGIRNKNWLILPPLFIPDDKFDLCWRSLVTEGPAFTDGYKVLVSTHSNLPSSGDFSKILFKAAETIRPLVPGVYTLNPADYIFSDGYIHANGFTDTNYYYFLPPDGPLVGKMEPHRAGLAEFAGKTIYIAFYHDSQDDSQLQIDDIVVSNAASVGLQNPDFVTHFGCSPNPAQAYTYVNWRLRKAESGVFQLLDVSGNLLKEQTFRSDTEGQLFLDISGMPAGIYLAVLQTSSGRVGKRVVKR